MLQYHAGPRIVPLVAKRMLCAVPPMVHTPKESTYLYYQLLAYFILTTSYMSVVPALIIPMHTSLGERLKTACLHRLPREHREMSSVQLINLGR